MLRKDCHKLPKIVNSLGGPGNVSGRADCGDRSRADAERIKTECRDDKDAGDAQNSAEKQAIANRAAVSKQEDQAEDGRGT